MVVVLPGMVAVLPSAYPLKGRPGPCRYTGMPRGQCALVPVLLACGLAAAQPGEGGGGGGGAPIQDGESSRPAAAGRVVGRYDFEERTTNPYPVPRNWSRHQDEPGASPEAPRVPRDGFPAWNQAYLDYSFAYDGEGSLCLPTGGGSTAARVDAGVLPVFPDADYLVSVRVRTNRLRHARARLSAWLLDRAGAVIEPSVMHGELVIAETGWVTTTISLPGRHPDAAFLQLELELLQPRQYARATLGPHQVWPQDIRGAAWFDDLTVAQLPRVSIATGGAANVTVAPDTPRLLTLVRDMTGERIASRVRVYDDLGALVDSAESVVEPGAGWREWSPRVSRFGWYRATLEVMQGPRRVGSTYVDFVWAPGGGAGASGRMNLVLADLPHSVLGALPDLARGAGAAGVTIPVWRASLEPAEVPAEIEAIAPSVARLLGEGRRVTFSLPRAPAGLAARARIDPDDPLSVLSSPGAEWEPMLLPFLDKFGQSVQRWQVGRHRAQPSWLRQDAAGTIASLQARIGRVVPGPRLVIPWPIEIAPPPDLLGERAPGLIALTVPPTARPEGLADVAASWLDAAGEEPKLPPIAGVFATLPEEEFSRRDVAADLLRRVIEFASGFDPVMPGAPPELGLLAPWSVRGERGGQVMPGVGLAVWANLSQRLRGRHVAGLFPVAPGVRCFILAPDAGSSAETTGALVAWREEPSASAAVHAYLGEGRVTAIDLYGNERAVPQVGDGAALTATAPHHLAITDDPVFLEGVDVEFAQFAASFRLEPGFAPCTQEEHEHRILLTNPWPTAVEGKLVIVEPGGYSAASGQRDRGWRITPRVSAFSAGPGETITLPVTIAFSPVEEAGVKDFIAEVELEGGRGRLRMRAPLEIGLDSIRLDLSYRFGPDPAGPDVIVEAMVGNNGTAPVTFEVGAFAPADAGYPRNRASVSGLRPGDTAVRRFGFPGGTAALRGKRITVGVTDIETGARINRSITIE